MSPSSQEPEGPRLAATDVGWYEKFTARGGFFKWLVNKPKFAATIPEDPSSPKTATLNVPNVIFRLVVLTVGMGTLVAILMWGILGLTVMPTVKVGTEVYVVDRAAWAEGTAPRGAYAVVSPVPVDRSMYAKFMSLLPQERGNDLVIIQGDVVPDQYLAECIQGPCVETVPLSDAGRLYTIPVTHVVGEPVAQIGWLHLTKVPRATSTNMGDS